MVDDGRSGGNPEADLPLVSIGVPVRNGAAHLSEALESVLAQDYPRYEVIVCDNGSDDATPEIAGAFARRDGRFLYVSNGKDLGFLANFRRTLELAHGTYFTWLAHDDLLSDRSYLSRTVRHLQDHPEVVCCFTGFSLSPFELAGSPDLRSFPEFSPDRWPAGRRQLFRWPHGWVDLAIYGVFRKAALDSVPIPHRTYRGRPHIFWWETEVLTALSGLGAIAALPEALRTYRRAAASAGHDAVSGVSTFDMLLLGLQIKYLLLVQALRLPVPPAEKLPIAATALGNLFRANVRQPFDHRRELRHLERQAAGLRRTAAERSRLLSSLRSVVAERRAAAGSTGEQMDDGPAAPPAPAAPERRSRLTDYFSPPTPEQSGYYLALSRHVEGLRRHVEEQARQIEKLHSEAA
ncbi:MAG TPA: glycosyltransferase family A protein, partial [Actinomycetota bacterium]|nr:glycosyltransferase family A protein [Actinomycetota bacterium]